MTGREIRKDKDAALHFGVWQGAITGERKQTGKTPLKLDLYGLSVRKQICPLRVATPPNNFLEQFQP